MRTLICFLVLLMACLPSISYSKAGAGDFVEGFSPLLPPAKADRKLLPHPRLYVTPDSIKKIREKLATGEYADYLAGLREENQTMYDAFLFLVNGDKETGERAKTRFLKDDVPRLRGLERTIKVLQYAILFDWLFPLFDSKEIVQAIELTKSKLKKNKREKQKNRIRYYFNDHWGRGHAFETVVALALAGSDPWADKVINTTYESSREYFSPYHGGALDTLNSLALSSGGGLQVGHHDSPGSGYEGMFLIGAMLFLPAWETATGESILDKTLFFEKFAEYLTYAFLHVRPLGNLSKGVLEISSGFVSEDSKALSKWLLESSGKSKYYWLFKLLFEDLKGTEAKSPEQLGLKKRKYLEGADLVVSRTGWDINDIAVFMFARHWDSGRYEPASGAISVYKGGQPVLVRGIAGKRFYDHSNNSGVWIWDARKELKKTLGQGSTYWHKLNNIPKKVTRANSATEVMLRENPEFRPETLVKFKETIDGITATTKYEKLLKYRGVELAQRQIEHAGSKIIITDTVSAPPTAKVLVSFRLAEIPVIQGSTAKTSRMELEVDAVDAKLKWIGGAGSELIGPTGEWHGNKKGGLVPGYSSNEKLAEKYGVGYLFVEPKAVEQRYQVRTKITVH